MSVSSDTDFSTEEEEAYSERNRLQRQTEAPWQEQKASLLLLLKSRITLKNMIAHKQYMERKFTGDLTASEVCNLLRSQGEAEEFDFATEITELQRNLLSDIRLVNDLERQVKSLDKAIALLIGNAAQVAQIDKKKQSSRKNQTEQKKDALTHQKLEKYANLFYLLQTEPEYLAGLMDCLEEPEDVRQLLDTIIITLYGAAFSPREEFLLLKFFEHSIEKIMSKATKIMDFVKVGFLPDMVLTYNKRKQGQEYLQSALGPVMNQFLSEPLQLDLNARQIYDTMVTEHEISSGVKRKRRNITDDECAQIPEVAAEVEKRIENLKKVSMMFFQAIIKSVHKVPFGLRWICKYVTDVAKDSFPKSPQDDINRLAVHFVYFRFINLGIVTPDTFKIVKSMLTPDSVFSLLQVSKVLYNLFNITPFHPTTEKWLAPMNSWIIEQAETARGYLAQLIDVDSPEDFLQVDQYMELTQMVKPVIMIKPSEITNTHELLQMHVSEIATKANDPLDIILKELGPPENYYDDGRDIQLTLVNRFPKIDDVMSEENQLLIKTKSMVIQAMRQIPKQYTSGQENLTQILDAGAAHSKESGNSKLRSLIHDIRSNLKKLQQMGKITSDDGYRAFLKDVALFVANKEQVREKQKKELARLQASLKNLKRQQSYLQEQIADFNRYRAGVKDHLMINKRRGRRNKVPGKLIDPIKFSYLDLVKKGVIIDSAVPKPVQRATKIFISSEEPGTFDVEVKVPGIDSQHINLLLEDLLDKKDRNVEKDDRGRVTLDVNMTLFFINQILQKK